MVPFRLQYQNVSKPNNSITLPRTGSSEVSFARAHFCAHLVYKLVDRFSVSKTFIPLQSFYVPFFVSFSTISIPYRYTPDSKIFFLESGHGTTYTGKVSSRYDYDYPFKSCCDRGSALARQPITNPIPRFFEMLGSR